MVDGLNDSPTIDVEIVQYLKYLNISNVAREVEGGASSDMVQDDVEEHIEEDKGILSNKEFKDLLTSSADDCDDAEHLEEAEPSI